MIVLTWRQLKPTGFEENYADAPITPAEYATERELYDPSISFASRIETAIQRYRARRKFHSDTAYVFGEFLRFGGIETGQKQFSGGIDKADIKDKSASEIAAMAAVDLVSEAVLDGSKWEVDFPAIAQGFL